MMLKSKKADYVRLKRLIAQDEILLLVHKKHKGLHKLFIYALCGLSLSYFDRAYERGDVILQLGKFGPRVGPPLSWQDVLSNYVSGKMKANRDTAPRTSKGNLGGFDAKLDSEIRKFERIIREHEDFLFGAKLFYEETKLIQPSSLLERTNFEKHYKRVKCRGERALTKAKKVLAEVKTSRNVDKLKEVEFPPPEKDIMPTAYPDNVPRMRLLVETYNELFPGRDRRIPLTKEEHKLIISKVVGKF